MAKPQRSLPKARRKRADVKSQARFKIPFWGWLALAGLIAIVLVGGLFYLDARSAISPATEIEGLVTFSDPGAGHEPGDIDYPQEVPPGGLHNSVWQNCGIYDEPVRPENVVHSLEHGAVWIAYQSDLAPDQVQTLRDLVRRERQRRRQSLIVLAPKPELGAPIVATAWQVQLELEDASDERLQLFVERFQKGPFTPEPGATCTGGVGNPS
jgi:hypothetical protein